MKLIRVASQTDDLTGFFSNEWSESIIIEPNSQIAVLNATFGLSTKNIQIPDCQITFQVKDGSGNLFTALIPKGNYSQAGFLSTITEMMNKYYFRSNLPTPNDGIDGSFIWDVGFDTKKNTHAAISFYKSNKHLADEDNTELTKMTYDDGEGVFASTKPSSVADQYEAFLVVSDVCLTYGFNTIHVDTYVNTGGAKANTIKVIVGLLESAPDKSATFISPADFIYGYYADGSDVFKIVSGVETKIGTVDAVLGTDGSGFDVEFSKGMIRFKLAGDTVVEYDIPFTSQARHIGVGAHSTGSCVDLRYMPSPLHSHSIAGAPVIKKTAPIEEHDLAAFGATVVEVGLLDDNIRIAMGYNNAYGHRIQALSGSFVAEAPLGDTTTPHSITVECPSLGGAIESYDGVSHKRRAIVSVIPAMVTSNNNLVYDPGFPIFVDLNNPHPIQLSRLDIRLLSSFKDEPINLEAPGCSITFGIKQRDHSVSKP